MGEMGIAVLSYPEIAPTTLASMRRACRDAEVELVEIPAHELAVRLDGTLSVHPLDGRGSGQVILHRTVYPYRDLVVPVLELLRASGRVVLNDPAAAVVSRNKLHTLLLLAEAGLPVVATRAVADASVPLDGLPARVVLKPALGTSGEGVRRCRAEDVGEHIGSYAPGLGPTLVQPFVAAPFDVRAFVVDGRCVGLAARHPAPGEWRCNVARGGRMRAVRDGGLAREAAELAAAAVDVLGLDYAAVDLLPHGDGSLLLSEVDAWGGYAALEASLGVDVSGAIVALARARWKG